MNPMLSKASVPITQASFATVHGLFLERARAQPDAVAIEFEGKAQSYGTLVDRARRLAAVLRARGVKPGDRVAILSENRPEYIEAELACAMCGAILACQNWRLVAAELGHCLTLVAPVLALVSPRSREAFEDACPEGLQSLSLGPDYENALASTEPGDVIRDADPESGLLILYTSGTTGLPKGALISHRAEIARMAALQIDCGVRRGDSFVAWAPMYHMASSDQLLATLMSGGAVVVVDGADVVAIADAVQTHSIGWLVMMPGPIGALIEELRSRGPINANVACVGAMADLVPRREITELTALLDAPYVNSFGATETGLPPATAAMIPVGAAEFSLDKAISTMCQVRLLGEDGIEVADGEPGEMAVRGPTLFSGYWANEATNLKDFSDGWFRMGDLFRRNPDGTISFVDRAKYMIKSGGENIYPAEIERVLLADPRIDEAVVVKRIDGKWGEVPVAFIAASEPLDLDDVVALCRGFLAGYKMPKDLRQIALEDFRRSTSGKVQRHELEALLGAE
ncbi:MAG: AMP-binding protein [Marinosulfonomonas sp.]|nr:AMP-binding protein [Marinosulfonomonas sp.]